MFDTTMIGKRIKQARIDKNMTQMALADAMGVSFQAVSNWERGNSMPDISKLGDLCAALDITVNELLGIDAPVVSKAMAKEELTMEELAEVAPVLLPEDVKVQMQDQCLHISVGGVDVEVKTGAGDASDGSEPQVHVMSFVDGVKVNVGETAKEKKTKKLDLSKIADLAPFLDEAYLEELVLEAELDDLDGLEEIAPFLSEQTLDKLVGRVPSGDLEELEEIFPFLGRQTLDKIAKRCVESGEFDALEELAVFLSEETLHHIALACADKGEFEAIGELAPFLGRKTLDDLVNRMIDQEFDPEQAEDISELYPFLAKDTLRKLANYLMSRRDLDAVEELVAYL